MTNLAKKVADAFLFRTYSPEDSLTDQPIYTTGSIVFGGLLRAMIILFITYWAVERYYLYQFWYFSLFIVWALAIAPAYEQYQNFHKRMEELKEETLCGTCKHFENGSQLCRIYDEHVSINHIPCEGDAWEPK
jgi:hypothetical protein